MSATGLPVPHIDAHFDSLGLCQCPCEQCAVVAAKMCVCLDCLCDPDDPEAPEHAPLILDVEWN